MTSALEDLTVPAPITADEPDTGPAVLAMAAAALDGADAAQLADRLETLETGVDVARSALQLGYHVRLYTPEPDEAGEDVREAGLLVTSRASVEDVRAALAARHAAIVSSPGDGPPFLLVLREDEDELVVDDPSVEERPLTWTWGRLGEMLETEPAPRVVELAPRNREDR